MCSLPRVESPVLLTLSSRRHHSMCLMSLITLSWTSLISIRSFGKRAEEGKVSEYHAVLQMLGLGFLFIALLLLFFTSCIFFFLVLIYGITFLFIVYSFVLTGVCLGNMYSKNQKNVSIFYYCVFYCVYWLWLHLPGLFPITREGLE